EERRQGKPRLPHDHIRGTGRHDVTNHQVLHDPLGRRWWLTREDPVVHGDLDGAGVRPPSITATKRLKLKFELVGRPQIIIVKKGNPLTARLDNPTISSNADAL